MDWLLQLPDPRDASGGAAGNDATANSQALRPLKGSASQQRLPSRGSQGGGPKDLAGAAPAKRAPNPLGGAGAAQAAVVRAARRPGSAQQQAAVKVAARTPPSMGLSSTLPSADTNVVSAPTMASIYGGGAGGVGAKAGATVIAAKPSGAAGMAAVRPLNSSATDPLLMQAARAGQNKGLLRTSSGLLPTRTQMVTPGAPPVGGSFGAAGVTTFGADGGLGRGLSRCSSTGMLAPSGCGLGSATSAMAASMGSIGSFGASSAAMGAHHGGAMGAKRLPSGAASGAVVGDASAAVGARVGGGSSRASAESFRSEALQLEVSWTEQLQALQEGEAEEETGSAHVASRRLELCRALFGRIIERDVPFGRLLERVRKEYEAALVAGVQPADMLPELERTRTELSRTVRENAGLKRRGTMLEEENALLCSELTKLAEREKRLRDEVKAYQAHAKEMEEAAEAQAQAEHAALTAELERELPSSARPGDVTPMLGGENNLPAKVPQAIVTRPAIVGRLDMSLVVAQRDADAKAEREEAAAAAAHEAAEHGDEDEDEDDEERMLAIEQAAAMMAAGKEVPEHLQAAVAAARERLRQMGWELDGDDEDEGEEDDYGDEEDDEANPYFERENGQPRTLTPAEQKQLLLGAPPGSTALSTAAAASSTTHKPPPAKPPPAAAAAAKAPATAPAFGGAPIPALNMNVLSDAKPLSYHSEFTAAEARNAAAGIPTTSEASAHVDKLLYGGQPGGPPKLQPLSAVNA